MLAKGHWCWCQARGLGPPPQQAQQEGQGRVQGAEQLGRASEGKQCGGSGAGLLQPVSKARESYQIGCMSARTTTSLVYQAWNSIVATAANAVLQSHRLDLSPCLICSSAQICSTQNGVKLHRKHLDRGKTCHTHIVSRRRAWGSPQRCEANLKEVFHHLRTHAGCDRGAVLQAGAAVHLNQPHIQVLIHHKVIAKQLMTVGA